jgi:hypothetical protein
MLGFIEVMEYGVNGHINSCGQNNPKAFLDEVHQTRST